MVEGNLVRALAYLSDLFEAALGRPFDLSDLDTEVVIDQIDFAGRHATAALFELRPDIGAMDPADRPQVLDALFQAHAEPLEIETKQLIHEAWCELSEALARQWCEEIDAALAHLDVVSFLIDPDALYRSMADASPSERVVLASFLETLELMVEEARDEVRARVVLN